MDRALNHTYISFAFGEEHILGLPTTEQLANLIVKLELELVQGIDETGIRMDLNPLKSSAWYLHGIASTKASSTYPLEQRRRAFAVSSHVLDLLLDAPFETDFERLTTAFAAQVGYHRADESPNASAIYRKVLDMVKEPSDLSDCASVAFQAGILLLGLDISTLSQWLHIWAESATNITRGTGLTNLDGTMFGPIQRLLCGVAEIVRYLREGELNALDHARIHLNCVVKNKIRVGDIYTRWIAAHLNLLAGSLAENSIWAVLPSEVPTTVKQAFTLGRQPVLTLWPPQRKLLTDTSLSPLSPDNSRLLVSVPTSAGKTLLAQIIICTHLARGEGGVCYVMPFRSLGREMRKNLRSRLRYLNFDIGLELPDVFGTWNPFEDTVVGGVRKDSEFPDVEIMTPERLMNALRHSPQQVLDRFSLFIVDEAHLMAEAGGRGLLLEGLLSLLNASASRLILLSGVLGNAGSLAKWASDGNSEVLFTDDWRAPRRLHILLGTEKIEGSRTQIPAARKGSKAKIRYDLCAHLAIRSPDAKVHDLVVNNGSPIGQLILDLNNKRIAGSSPHYEMSAKVAASLLHAGSLLMIVSTRVIARNAAKVIADQLEKQPKAQGLADSIAERLGSEHPLVAVLRKGIAYHHAGLPVEVQEAIEDAIRSGTVKAVVATRTLTDGVNLPVRTIIISTSEYKQQDPKSRMNAAQFLNAVGRAGRAGKETEGWIILAPQKAISVQDFDRFTPSSEELEVQSTMATESALVALGEIEDLITETQDAILSLLPTQEVGGFVSYVWFVLHTIESIPQLKSILTWRKVLENLFAFTQLTEDLKKRWLNLAEYVAVRYELTSFESRRRWVQAGTSLSSASQIESTAKCLADCVRQRGYVEEQTLEETLNLLAEQEVYSTLLRLPEAKRYWRFKRTTQGKEIVVDINSVVGDWVAGSSLPSLAERYLSDVSNSTFRLEQMVDGVTEGIQHYLSWTVGVVVAQVNEILAERMESARLFRGVAGHLRYGVDTTIALRLLVEDFKSRTLAQRLGRFAQYMALDEEGLRSFLGRQQIKDWREGFDATPTDVLDLLNYVEGRKRHKLAELMAAGVVSARVRLNVKGRSSPVSVSVVMSEGGDELQVLAEDRSLLGTIIARDHDGVAAVLDSGLLLEFVLKGTTLTIARAESGQLSFI